MNLTDWQKLGFILILIVLVFGPLIYEHVIRSERDIRERVYLKKINVDGLPDEWEDVDLVALTDRYKIYSYFTNSSIFFMIEPLLGEFNETLAFRFFEFINGDYKTLSVNPTKIKAFAKMYDESTGKYLLSEGLEARKDKVLEISVPRELLGEENKYKVALLFGNVAPKIEPSVTFFIYGPLKYT